MNIDSKEYRLNLYNAYNSLIALISLFDNLKQQSAADVSDASANYDITEAYKTEMALHAKNYAVAQKANTVFTQLKEQIENAKSQMEALKP